MGRSFYGSVVFGLVLPEPVPVNESYSGAGFIMAYTTSSVSPAVKVTAHANCGSDCNTSVPNPGYAGKVFTPEGKQVFLLVRD